MPQPAFVTPPNPKLAYLAGCLPIFSAKSEGGGLAELLPGDLYLATISFPRLPGQAAKGKDPNRASYALAFYRQLFDIEDACAEFSPEDRLAKRLDGRLPIDNNARASETCVV